MLDRPWWAEKPRFPWLELFPFMFVSALIYYMTLPMALGPLDRFLKDITCAWAAVVDWEWAFCFAGNILPLLLVVCICRPGAPLWNAILCFCIERWRPMSKDGCSITLPFLTYCIAPLALPENIVPSSSSVSNFPFDRWPGLPKFEWTLFLDPYASCLICWLFLGFRWERWFSESWPLLFGIG